MFNFAMKCAADRRPNNTGVRLVGAGPWLMEAQHG